MFRYYNIIKQKYCHLLFRPIRNVSPCTNWYISYYPPPVDHVNLLPKYNTYISVRYKSRKSKKNVWKVDEESSDEEDNTNDVDFDDPDVVVRRLSSKRLDVLLKSGFRLSRSKTEEAFLSNKIKVNGNILKKKSYNVLPGDEIVIFSERNENDELVEMGKLTVKSIKFLEAQELFEIKFNIQKN